MLIDTQSLEKSIITFKKLVPFTIAGSILGVRCVLSISEDILNVLVVVMILIVAIYTFVSKNLGQEDNFESINKKNLRLGMLMALIMGFYDGFFGPGTGTFLTFGFIKYMDMIFTCFCKYKNIKLNK